MPQDNPVRQILLLLSLHIRTSQHRKFNGPAKIHMISWHNLTPEPELRPSARLLSTRRSEVSSDGSYWPLDLSF
jgi:hypothetical protein